MPLIPPSPVRVARGIGFRPDVPGKALGMKIAYRFREMGRLEKIVLAVAAFFALYSVVGFLLFPFVLKSIAVKTLSERLHRKVSIQGVGLNPYVLSVRVKGLTVQQLHSSNSFAGFDKLYVNLQAISLVKRALVIKELDITQPSLMIIRTAANRYNFSDLIQKKKATEPKGKSSATRFSVHNIRILDGRIDIKDIPKDTIHKITDIKLDIPAISDLAVDVDTWVKPAFSARINGSPMSLKGEAKPFAGSRDSILDVAITDVDIPYYHAYFPANLNLKIVKGTFSLDTKLEYARTTKDRPPAFKITGDVKLKDLEAKDPKDTTILKLTELDVGIASFEPFADKLHLAKINFHPFLAKV